MLPMNIQSWFPLGLTGLILSQSKSLLQHHSSKASILPRPAFFLFQLSHPSIDLSFSPLSRANILERAVQTCCVLLLKPNWVLSALQAGFHPNHFSETAVPKMTIRLPVTNSVSTLLFPVVISEASDIAVHLILKVHLSLIP